MIEIFSQMEIEPAGDALQFRDIHRHLKSLSSSQLSQHLEELPCALIPRPHYNAERRNGPHSANQGLITVGPAMVWVNAPDVVHSKYHFIVLQWHTIYCM